MNRRTLLKTTLPAGLLLAGCTSQSDESDSTTSSNTSTATTTVSTSTKTSTSSQTQPTESTTKQETHSTTQSTTDHETTSTSPSTTEQSTTKQTTTTAAHTKPDHPSASGIFDEPTRGPTPFSTDATLIAFEDPSCPNCVHFEEETYPKLKRNHIDSGELSFVLRTIPVIDEWGTRAIYALEATHIRDEQAFWDLKTYYFDNQDQFTSDNVFSKTEAFIDKETQLDGQDIVGDAQSKAQKTQVKEDLSVARATGLRGTPAFFAFRSGEYVTQIIGRQSYSIFKNVLGL
jgi:protein-disulfide isomerase